MSLFLYRVLYAPDLPTLLHPSLVGPLYVLEFSTTGIHVHKHAIYPSIMIIAPVSLQESLLF